VTEKIEPLPLGATDHEITKNIRPRRAPEVWGVQKDVTPPLDPYMAAIPCANCDAAPCDHVEHQHADHDDFLTCLECNPGTNPRAT
jgi:hypothetical protein